MVSLLAAIRYIRVLEADYCLSDSVPQEHRVPEILDLLKHSALRAGCADAVRPHQIWDLCDANPIASCKQHQQYGSLAGVVMATSSAHGTRPDCAGRPGRDELPRPDHHETIVRIPRMVLVARQITAWWTAEGIGEASSGIYGHLLACPSCFVWFFLAASLTSRH